VICDAPEMHLEWREALTPGRVLILGEMHGTQQSPQVAAIAVCDALRAGRSVGLFMEWPTSLQDALPDESQLLKSQFFTATTQDGRRSHEMLGLAMRVQTWAKEGAPVSVVPMDPVDGDRDAGMATAVRVWMDAHPQSVAVVLVGNVHARLTKGFHSNADYESLGYRLLDLGDRVRSLDVRYANGSGWFCSPDCGVHPLSGESRGDEWKIDWFARGTFDGTYYIGAPTPSLPAVLR
jgi:hypothetical protein